jgi:uncharacterized RDD family membrane protein YckC
MTPGVVRASHEGTRGAPIELVTPEGVPLVFHVAPAGDRIVALLLDLLVLVVAIGLAGLVLAFAAHIGGSHELVGAIALIVVFALRYGYFTFFELRSRGSTPGKRRVGIRVVDGAGGPLTGEAVIVRNLVREIELFVPLMVLAQPQLLASDDRPLVRAAAIVWTLGFAAVPLVNRRRLRLGDAFAGTMVVVVPRVTLLKDASQEPRTTPGTPSPAPASAFTDAQLDVYGEYELQVLEDVLRRGRGARHDEAAFVAVAERIAAKIGWTTPVAGPAALAFLRDYYAALRARLERRRVLGRRKADKHAR